MSDDYDGQVEFDARTEEFLEHFGVKGMKWGVRKAGSVATAPARQGIKNARDFAKDPIGQGKRNLATVGRVASAPARQGLKNAKTVSTALKNAQTKQNKADEAYVKKHGELGATLRKGGRDAAVGVLASAVTRRLIVKNLRTDPKRAAGIAVVGATLQAGILAKTLVDLNRIDSAANRINDNRGKPRSTYVSKGTRKG